MLVYVHVNYTSLDDNFEYVCVREEYTSVVITNVIPRILKFSGSNYKFPHNLLEYLLWLGLCFEPSIY